MKTIISLSLACIAGFYASAQKIKTADVPASVKEEFAKKFPKADDVTWKKEGTAEYEAEFEIAHVEQSANFDVSGKWLEAETEIKPDALPQAVRASIAKDFAGYKVKEIEKVETPEAAVLYEVELKKDKTEYEVQYSMEGVLVKKEMEKDKDKDKK